MSSPKIQPIDHISTAVEYSVAPNSNSGALCPTERAIQSQQDAREEVGITHRYHRVTTN